MRFGFSEQIPAVVQRRRDREHEQTPSASDRDCSAVVELRVILDHCCSAILTPSDADVACHYLSWPTCLLRRRDAGVWLARLPGIDLRLHIERATGRDV
jgi:hypothetical protein